MESPKKRRIFFVDDEQLVLKGLQRLLRRMRRIIRENATKPAKEIVSAVMHDFQQFIHPVPQNDDATLVVIKVES